MSVSGVGHNAGPNSSLSLNQSSRSAEALDSAARIAPHSNKINHRSDGGTETPILKMQKPDGSTHVLYRSAGERAAEASPTEPQYSRGDSDMPEKTVLKIYGPDGRERGHSAPEPAHGDAAGEAQDAEHLHEPGVCGCKTCSERLYQDKSTDSGVSFQSPGHISPSASLSLVSSHEMEHVSRESRDAKESGQKIISRSVQIHMARCPECSRTYAAGGVTKISKMKVAESQPAVDTAKPRFDMAI